jgi:hypothetical protein
MCRGMFCCGNFIAALIGVLVTLPGIGHAQNLLINPGLEFPENTFYHSVPDGWEMTEGPAVPFLPGPYLADYNQSGATPANCELNGYCNAVDAADYTVWRDHFGATQAANGYTLPNEAATTGNVSIADYNQWKLHFGAPHALSMAEPTNFPHTLLEGNWNMWFQPYNGTFAALPEALNNFAHLTQTVPATPGTNYTLKGWASFEPHFAGGRTNLNLAGSSATPPDDGPLSPTDTFFALDFFDSSGTLLDTEEIELFANGQQNSPAGGNLVWMQHTLSAVAPAGTANVKVRITMLNGVLNPDVDPQSMFVDFFELTAGAGAGGASAVPEPTTSMLSVIALGMLLTARSKSCRRRS